MINFGSIIHDARTKKNLTLAELASKITTIDGSNVSTAYLCDIEHGKRQPSSGFIIEQFALALDINSAILYYYVGKIPSDIRGLNVSQDQIIEAFQAFRETLNDNVDQSLYVKMPPKAASSVKVNVVRKGKAKPLED